MTQLSVKTRIGKLMRWLFVSEREERLFEDLRRAQDNVRASQARLRRLAQACRGARKRQPSKEVAS